MSTDLTIGSIVDSATKERSMTIKGDDHATELRNIGVNALNEFTTDVPYGLRIEETAVTIPADVNGSDSDVMMTTRTTTDAWTLELRSSTDGVLEVESDWLPTLDGSWDGLMWLAVKHPTTGRWLILESRRWYEGTISSGGVGRYYVTLRRPWPGYADLPGALTEMETRIFARYVYLPDDVIRIDGEPRLFSDDGRDVGCISPQQAASIAWNDLFPEKWSSGTPTAIWRQSRVTPVMSSTFAPLLSAGDPATWVGPVQEGSWRVRYTIRLGKRDAYWDLSENSDTLVDPLWESAPSPPSELFRHSANAGKSILMQFPDIAAMENFRPAVATLRSLKVGFKIGIWVGCFDVRTAGAGSYNFVPEDGTYHLLTELEDGDTTLEWTGSLIPQRSRRLRPQSGSYDAYCVYPRPDVDYTLLFRAVRKPAPLENDSDVIPIEAAYSEVFRLLYLSHLCRNDGADIAAAEYYYKLYRNKLADFRAEQSKKRRGGRVGWMAGQSSSRGVELIGTSSGMKVRVT